MIELDDCGRELHLQIDKLWANSMDVKVQMVIKAPRGTMTLFSHGPFRRSLEVEHVMVKHYYFNYQKEQCRAIKAFMDEHEFDGIDTTNIKTKEEANELASRMLRRHHD